MAEWGLVFVTPAGEEHRLLVGFESEAEAYLIALQINEHTSFRVETRRYAETVWEVYRNGPGAERVRVSQFPSEAMARSFVRAEKRVRVLLQGSGLGAAFGDLTPPEVLYTVEPKMEEIGGRINCRCRMGRLPGARRAPQSTHRPGNRGG